MKKFDILFNFTDGSTQTIQIQTINYRTAMQQVIAFIPAWSNRVVQNVSVRLCGA